MELAFVGRLLAACVVIALVLAGVQFVAKRSMRLRIEGGDNRLVTLLETTYLPGAASVHVLRVGETYLVVGRGSGDLATLCDIDPAFVEAHLARHGPPRGRAFLSAFSPRRPSD
ncbi:MAG: hypothetical protein NVS3B17_04790 [Vulcanimicrobiaceae bacterium]